MALVREMQMGSEMQNGVTTDFGELVVTPFSPPGIRPHLQNRNFQQIKIRNRKYFFTPYLTSGCDPLFG
jgi:hypothetical protein